MDANSINSYSYTINFSCKIQEFKLFYSEYIIDKIIYSKF